MILTYILTFLEDICKLVCIKKKERLSFNQVLLIFQRKEIRRI